MVGSSGGGGRIDRTAWRNLPHELISRRSRLYTTLTFNLLNASLAPAVPGRYLYIDPPARLSLAPLETPTFSPLPSSSLTRVTLMDRRGNAVVPDGGLIASFVSPRVLLPLLTLRKACLILLSGLKPPPGILPDRPSWAFRKFNKIQERIWHLDTFPSER